MSRNVTPKKWLVTLTNCDITLLSVNICYYPLIFVTSRYMIFTKYFKLETWRQARNDL